MRGTIAVLAAAALVAAAAPAPAPARAHVTRPLRATRRARAPRRPRRPHDLGRGAHGPRPLDRLPLPRPRPADRGSRPRRGDRAADAIDEYDARRGTSFSTYAFWRVRAAVTHAVTAQRTLVRIPRPVLERRRQVAQVRCDACRRRARTEPDRVGRRDGTATGGSRRSAGASARCLARPAAGRRDTARRLARRRRRQRGRRRSSSRASRDARCAIALQHLRGRKQTIVKRHFGIDGEPETLTRSPTTST